MFFLSFYQVLSSILDKNIFLNKNINLFVYLKVIIIFAWK